MKTPTVMENICNFALQSDERRRNAPVFVSKRVVFYLTVDFTYTGKKGT